MWKSKSMLSSKLAYSSGYLEFSYIVQPLVKKARFVYNSLVFKSESICKVRWILQESHGPLKGVVIGVSKKLGVKQSEYNNIAAALGADYRWTYDSTCTHFIFQVSSLYSHVFNKLDFYTLIPDPSQEYFKNRATDVKHQQNFIFIY